jgi:hypothetical protein
MGKPLEIEVDIGGSAPIRYTIPEDVIREHAHIDVRAVILQQSADDTDEARTCG